MQVIRAEKLRRFEENAKRSGDFARRLVHGTAAAMEALTKSKQRQAEVTVRRSQFETRSRMEEKRDEEEQRALRAARPRRMIEALEEERRKKESEKELLRRAQSPSQ
jgi:hypothetical protein